MSILRAAGTIGGLTMVSRIFGFVREMLLSRLLGAGLAADCFFLAFKLPNLFRRFFAEGAFSAAFVPLVSRKLGEDAGDPKGARQIAEEILAVFVPVLLLFTALMEAVMPGLVWVLGSGFTRVPGKFEFAVELTRLTFPYLMLISLASLLAGLLNALSRFIAAAAAPILLNVAMMLAIILFHDTEEQGARALSLAVTIGGVLQFILLLIACRRAGILPKLRWPRLTPSVRQFGRLILPAAFGAGLYQVSQLIDLMFAGYLPQGSLSILSYADRINQLPLGVIGVALGTAILPLLSRRIGSGDTSGASDLQNRAVELALLLTLPAAGALAVLGTPLVTAFYAGGKFDADAVRWTGWTLSALVLGLPSYVLVKVLTPGFFARGDTKTPVITAAIALSVNVALNFALIGSMKIVGLALATAIASWLNCLLLGIALHKRGHYRVDRRLASRAARALLATLLMTAALYGLLEPISPYTHGSALERLAAVGAFVGVGGLVYGGAVWMLGAARWSEVRAQLRRSKSPEIPSS